MTQHSDVTTLPTKSKSMADDKLLSRLQACRALGISKAELIRRERGGELSIKPVRAANGWWMYRAGDIRKLTGNGKTGYIPGMKGERVTTIVKGRDYNAETAAIVFKALRNGDSLEEIVISHEVHPEDVRLIYKEWTVIRGGLLLSPEHVSTLQTIGMRGKFPVVDAEVLVGNIRETVDAMRKLAMNQKTKSSEKQEAEKAA